MYYACWQEFLCSDVVDHECHGYVDGGDCCRASGEVIAKLGSSGSTSIGPHLHFHVANTNSLLAAEGLPFVFSDFVQSGGFASIDALVNGELPSMTDGERRATMQRPAPNAIVRFR